MKRNNIENLIEALYSVRMTEYEKKAMREYVLGFRSTSMPSPYHKLMTVMYRSMSMAFIAVLALGSISKPVSAGALPGEFLYPIKLIHEEIESVTKQGAEEKISHEIERANKRVEEAAELAEKKTLDPYREEQLVKNIKKHTNKVREEIKELKVQDPIKALELNHKLQDSIKSNVELLKTKELDAPATAKLAATPVSEEVVTTEELLSESEPVVAAEETLAVPETTEIVLPEINEMDITLSAKAVPLQKTQDTGELNSILKEMEADLKIAEEESEEVEKDISKTVIAPSGISETDEILTENL